MPPVNRYYKCSKGGALELDESYFGPRRVRGKRGCGAGSKTIVFGLFKRGGQVYTKVVPDCSEKTLQGIIRGKIDPAALVNTAGGCRLRPALPGAP